MRKIGIPSLLLVMVVTFAVLAVPVFAAWVGSPKTKTVGATTVTVNSTSFHDMNYTVNTTITMTVDWTVDAGAASYDGFALKRFTPKSRKDPALGTLPTVTHPGSNGDNSVDVAFKFTDLHLDKHRDVDIGNAHFKLYLMMDEDGDRTPETRAGWGINVHVEDLQ